MWSFLIKKLNYPVIQIGIISNACSQLSRLNFLTAVFQFLKWAISSSDVE